MDNTVSNKTKIEKGITEYLEKKYGEKFVIDRLVADDGNNAPNKAYVYPEGKESDWFAVRFEIDEKNNMRDIRDGYSFIAAEKQLLPAYQAWIDEILPNGKVVLYIENENEVTRENHSVNFELEEFMKAEFPFALKVNIFVEDETTSDKTAFLEKLSRSIDEKLQKGFSYKITVVFYGGNLETLDVSKYRDASLYTFKSSDDNFVAFTKVFVVEEMSQTDIFDELKLEFTDDMSLNLSGMEEDEEGGIENE